MKFKFFIKFLSDKVFQVVIADLSADCILCRLENTSGKVAKAAYGNFMRLI